VTRILKTSAALLACLGFLSGCQVAKTTGKVAALPVKATYKTGELAGKSVYYMGKYTGQGVYETGKFAGKSVYTAGKGVYYIGTVPVEITDRALDTTSKVLTVTTQAADATGKIVTVSRQIQAYELEAELQAVRKSANILRVFVDAAG